MRRRILTIQESTAGFVDGCQRLAQLVPGGLIWNGVPVNRLIDKVCFPENFQNKIFRFHRMMGAVGPGSIEPGRAASAAMELADNLTGAIAGVVTVSDDDLTRNDGCIVARTLHSKTPASMGEVIDVLSVVR